MIQKTQNKKHTNTQGDAKKKQNTAAAGLGLSGIGDLAGLLREEPENQGIPQELPLNQIDEDPNQPRQQGNPGFSKESIQEIGATIAARGVKSPISVRESPTAPGRYIINHGARRYRGAKWAGKTTIPAFVDNDYNEADQIIENLQRNELTAREIADFIGRELAKGKKKGDIAREIGKSSSFVTQHITLLDLPESIAEAFHAGRVNDVTLICELATAHKKNPNEVAEFLANDQRELTRDSVKMFRELLEEDGQDLDEEREERQIRGNDVEKRERVDEEEMEDAKEKKEPRSLSDPDKFTKAIIQVKCEGQPARLVLSRRPKAEGWAWVRYDKDGREHETDLRKVRIVALVEG